MSTTNISAATYWAAISPLKRGRRWIHYDSLRVTKGASVRAFLGGEDGGRDGLVADGLPCTVTTMVIENAALSTHRNWSALARSEAQIAFVLHKIGGRELLKPRSQRCGRNIGARA